MDPFNLAYYATICGLLSVASGRIAAWWARIVTGGVVGLVAAGALPVLRASLGFG